jgi:tetratricopeptide (TPR) repeat protein
MTSRLDQMLAFLEQDPNDSFSRYAVALEYASRRKYPAAIEQLDELRRRDPDYVALYYQLGDLQTKMEEWDLAEQAYTEGITVARRIGDTHTLSELQMALDELETMR